MSSNRKRSYDVSGRRRAQQRGKIPWVYIIPAIILVAIIIGLVYVNSRTGVSGATHSVDTSLYPFACLGSEQLTFHIHIWLRIIVNGQNITIPAAIGIVNPSFASYGNEQVASSGSCFEPMHTHDSSGIIHIESSTNTNYTLGEFFQIWNVTYGTVLINGVYHPIIFNSTDILGYTADATHKIVLLVDDVQNSLYGSLVLNQYDYCSSSNSGVPPCSPTAGAPYWNGQNYPYGTGHTIVIKYENVTS